MGVCSLAWLCASCVHIHTHKKLIQCVQMLTDKHVNSLSILTSWNCNMRIFIIHECRKYRTTKVQLHDGFIQNGKIQTCFIHVNLSQFEHVSLVRL